MKEYKGILNEEGLSSYNQRLFDNMAYFSDLVWVIDVNREMVEIIYDTIEKDTVGRTYTLEELRKRISARYPSRNTAITRRYTVEFLKELKEDVVFNNPTFLFDGRRYKLRYVMSPEVDEAGNTDRIYVTGINMEDFLASRRENAEIYKTVSMILSHSTAMEQGINDVLKFLGQYMNVSRTYIFETDHEDDGICHNTFEWCSEGIQPQMHNLQNVLYSEYGYFDLFDESQLFYCTDSSLANDSMRAEMENQGIKAMINYAFYEDNRLAGFIGIDDCTRSRDDWNVDDGDLELLTYVADLISSYLIRERTLIHAKAAEEAEKSLRLKDEENSVLLKHFVEAYTSAYSVNLKDKTFEILHMSHEFSSVFTMNGGLDDMARFVEEHVHPDDRELMRQMTDPDFMRVKMREQSEVTFTLREQYYGAERTMHVTVIRGVDADHVAIGFLDVTAEIQKEKELNEKLEAAARARRDFLSSMSHDIRTPMNAILGMVDIALSHTDDTERMIDSIKKIRTSGNYLLMLVNDILDISSIESGKTQLRPVVHSAEDKKKFIHNTIQGILNGKDIKFTFDQHDIIQPYFVVDEIRMNQIINNLLSNAVKYTPDGGSVICENWHELDADGKPWNYIRVSDTGIGMSEEFMEQMWDAFSRATDTRINTIQGAGLGLSIVKSLVEMMGGTITVESQLNVGSTFTVKLPIIPAKEEDIPVRVDDEDLGDFTTHLLVAEDNDINWEVVYELLKESGITCERAENGE
ncbi:MAG: hypothetical protein HUJ75_04300, partial [Parasporobacterium sp.]|nr:hypothetical protein [Parasporobacterium sp.]